MRYNSLMSDTKSTKITNQDRASYLAESHREAFAAYCKKYGHKKPRAPKGDFHFVPCDGEAHKEGGINHDNCMTCAPNWGKVLVSIDCADLEAWYTKLHALSGAPRGALLNACAAYQRAHTRYERYEQQLRDLRRSFLYDFEDGELAPEIRALMHL